MVREQPCDGAWQQRCRCRGEPSDDQPAGEPITQPGQLLARGRDAVERLAGVPHQHLPGRSQPHPARVVSGEDQDEADTYFDTKNFAFHGPDGFDADYAGLTEYFRSLRAAFDDRTIRRGIIVAEGEYIACQTWIEGTFVRPFTQSPAGRLEPSGA